MGAGGGGDGRLLFCGTCFFAKGMRPGFIFFAFFFWLQTNALCQDLLIFANNPHWHGKHVAVTSLRRSADRFALRQPPEAAAPRPPVR